METVKMTSKAEYLTLSFHSLCNLCRLTGFAYPQEALPLMVASGKAQGMVTMDDYGNVTAFK